MVNTCISPTPSGAMLRPQYVKAPKAFTGLKQHCSRGRGREGMGKNTVGMSCIQGMDGGKFLVLFIYGS